MMSAVPRKQEAKALVASWHILFEWLAMGVVGSFESDGLPSGLLMGEIVPWRNWVAARGL